MPRNHTLSYGSLATTRKPSPLTTTMPPLPPPTGRVTAEFVLLSEQREAPHSIYLFNNDDDVKGATLHDDEGEVSTPRSDKARCGER